MKKLALRGLTGLIAGVACIWGVNAQALPSNTNDARAVAEAVNKRDEGDRVARKIVLTLTDANGRERVRELKSFAKKFDGGRKTLMLFAAPAAVKNTGFLSFDYNAGKLDEQWLYLPSLHRTTRIAAGDKSKAFLGTDFTYADLTKSDPSQYDYKMLDASTVVDGEEAWLIEARPRTEKEKSETGYIKLHQWISKSKLMPIRMKAWVAKGKLTKYFLFSAHKKVDGIWFPGRTQIKTMKGNTLLSSSVLEATNIKTNQPTISEETFTERRLELGL